MKLYEKVLIKIYRAKWDWRMSRKARGGDKDALVKELTALQKRMKAHYARGDD